MFQNGPTFSQSKLRILESEAKKAMSPHLQSFQKSLKILLRPPYWLTHYHLPGTRSLQYWPILRVNNNEQPSPSMYNNKESKVEHSPQKMQFQLGKCDTKKSGSQPVIKTFSPKLAIGLNNDEILVSMRWKWSFFRCGAVPMFFRQTLPPLPMRLFGLNHCTMG